MKLHILGSSSNGNGYVLESSQQEFLCIEAGVKFDQVKAATDYNVHDIEGVLVSHSHGDHIKYVQEYMQYSVLAYMLEDTGKEWLAKNKLVHMQRNMRYFKPNKKYHIGSYQVLPFTVAHDVPCVGFLIHHEEMGLLCYLTDTMYSKHLFPANVCTYLVEANYDEEILNENGTAGFLRNRVMTSHMEIGTTIEMLRANNLKETKRIILCHLSDRNSNAKAFQDRVQAAFGIPTMIAEPGMVVDIKKEPF